MSDSLASDHIFNPQKFEMAEMNAFMTNISPSVMKTAYNESLHSAPHAPHAPAAHTPASSAEHAHSGEHATAHSAKAESHSHSAGTLHTAGHSSHSHHGHANTGHHTAHGNSGHHQETGHSAVSVQPVGEAALTSAIADHMSKHGMANEVSHASHLGHSVSGYLNEPHAAGTALALHKEGEVMASVYGEGTRAHSAGDPPAISADTLSYVKEHGVPQAGLDMVRHQLAQETHGMSDLDLIEKVGGNTLEKLGREGLDVAKLDQVQGHVNTSLEGSGFEVNANRLDSLKIMAEMDSHPGNNLLVVDKESGSTSVKSFEEFAKQAETSGADRVAALDMTEVKMNMGMSVSDSAPESGHAEAHEAKAEAAHEAAGAEMTM